MKLLNSLILLLLIAKFATAQNVTDIKAYLNDNNTTINFSDTNGANIFFKSVMKNKTLFVLGEGGSHNLDLYNKLRVYLITPFTHLNLKYFFIEYGRSFAEISNNYLKSNIDYSDSIYRKSAPYKIQMQKIRKLYQNGRQFIYKGIDMERGASLYLAIKELTSNVNYSTVKSSSFLNSLLVDTSYLHYDDSDEFNNQKHFLRFYKTLQNNFASDSNLLIKSMPSVNYDKIKYFISNPQTKPPNGDRNPGMAKNLLNEINIIDTNATYLLSIGIAHSLLNFKRNVVGILNSSDLLTNKIVVMNVYCDKCSVNGKEINDPRIDFMKGDILETFRTTAKSNLTIFDLSKVPPQLQYLKKYGDLILFAKQQQ